MTAVDQGQGEARFVEVVAPGVICWWGKGDRSGGFVRVKMQIDAVVRGSKRAFVLSSLWNHNQI
jgi:hypothetical protein